MQHLFARLIFCVLAKQMHTFDSADNPHVTNLPHPAKSRLFV